MRRWSAQAQPACGLSEHRESESATCMHGQGMALGRGMQG